MKKSMVESVLRGVVYLFLLVSSVSLMTPVLIVPALLLLPFSVLTFRWWMDTVEESWFTFVWYLIEMVLGTRMVLSGDNVPTACDERVLVISNHRTRLDWMFLWGFFLREGRLRHLKIVLKQLLKKFHPFSWPMQTSLFIFLARNFDSDKIYIQQMLQYFSTLRLPVQLLLFPEGTDKTPNTTKRSNEFGAKNGYRSLEYTLHPRETGFNFILQLSRKLNLIDAVYDVTVAYPDIIPQNETSVFTGAPAEVHVHLRRFPIQDIPENEADSGEWLRQVWYHKDELLAQFHQSGEKKFGESPGHVHRPFHGQEEVKFRMGLQLVLWLTAVSVALYLFLTTSSFFWYTIFSWVFLVIATALGGLDHLELSLYRKFHRN